MAQYSNFSSRFSYARDAKFEQSVKPSFGVILLTKGKSQSPVIALHSELQYTTAEFEGPSIHAKKTSTTVVILEKGTTAIDFKMINAKLGFRFTLRSNIINPFISGGMAYSFSMGSRSSFESISPSVEIQKDFMPFGTSFGLWGSGGLKITLTERMALNLDITIQDFPQYSGSSLQIVNPRIALMFNK